MSYLFQPSNANNSTPTTSKLYIFSLSIRDRSVIWLEKINGLEYSGGILPLPIARLFDLRLDTEILLSVLMADTDTLNIEIVFLFQEIKWYL